MSTATRVVRIGDSRLRIGPWRGQDSCSYVAPIGLPSPSASELHSCITSLSRVGYRRVVTAALGTEERQPFLEAGFHPKERLHLLVHDLTGLDPGESAVQLLRTRRAKRVDRDAVLAVDNAAFDDFWRLDASGLADALNATPARRFRVARAQDSGPIAGYAIAGRSGSRAYLQRLAVRPDQQGRGIGTALTIDALQWAARRHARSVLVNTQERNERALCLYLRLGFRHQPDDLLVLERQLT